MDSNNFSVLIPDGETHVLTEVVYSLCQIKGIKLYVMSNKKNITLRYSRYIHHFSFYPKADTEEQWVSYINTELANHKIDVIMPIYEHGIRTLSKFGKLLASPEKLVALPELKWFDAANDKSLLAQHLSAHEIPGPHTVKFDSVEQLDSKMVKYPVIVKKINGVGGGRDVYLFKKEKALKRFLINRPADQYLFQEYIKGYDIDCSVLCNQGTVLAFTIQRGTMFGRNKFVPQLGLEFLFEKELYELASKLMKTLHWSGVAHIDLRYDSRDRQFKVIEVNPRFWASVDASTLAGVNFPYLLCLHLFRRKFDRPSYEHIRYLSLRGLVKRMEKMEISKLNVRFVWHNTPLKFAMKDPIPTFFNIIRSF